MGARQEWTAQRRTLSCVPAGVSPKPTSNVLYAAQVGRIYGFLARRVGATLAEDLTAQVFVEAWAGRERFDASQGGAVGWLFGIATNLLRRHHRREETQLRAFARIGVDPEDTFDEDAVVDRLMVRDGWKRVAGVALRTVGCRPGHPDVGRVGQALLRRHRRRPRDPDRYRQVSAEPGPNPVGAAARTNDRPNLTPWQPTTISSRSGARSRISTPTGPSASGANSRPRVPRRPRCRRRLLRPTTTGRCSSWCPKPKRRHRRRVTPAPY